MAWNSNPLSAYRETGIKTAGQGRIVVMLYDEAIKQLDIAKSLFDTRTRELDKIHNAIARAQEVITELTVSLNFDSGGEIAKNLFGLYVYFHGRLMEANIKKDAEPVTEVRAHLASLREAWEQIVRKNVPHPKGDTASGSSGGVNIAG